MKKKYILLALIMITPKTQKSIDNPILNGLAIVAVGSFFCGIVYCVACYGPEQCVRCQGFISRRDFTLIDGISAPCGHYFHKACYATHYPCEGCQRDIARANLQAAQEMQDAAHQINNSILRRPEPPVVIYLPQESQQQSYDHQQAARVAQERQKDAYNKAQKENQQKEHDAHKAQEIARQEAQTASTNEALAMQKAAEESIKTAHREQAQRNAQEEQKRNARAQKQFKQSFCALCDGAFSGLVKDSFELVPCEHVVHKACAQGLVDQGISQCPKCHIIFQLDTLTKQLKSVSF